MNAITSPIKPLVDQFETAAAQGDTMTMNFDDHFQVKGAVSSVQRIGRRNNPKSVLVSLSDGSTLTITGKNSTQVLYTVNKANGETFETIMDVTGVSREESDGKRSRFFLIPAGIAPLSVSVTIAIAGIIALALGL